MEQENEEFEEQLEQEKLEKIKTEEGDSNTYTDKDGKMLVKDVKIDENFIACYQMHYGKDSAGDSSEVKGEDEGKEGDDHSKESYDYYKNYYKEYYKDHHDKYYKDYYDEYYKDYYQNYYNSEEYKAYLEKGSSEKADTEKSTTEKSDVDKGKPDGEEDTKEKQEGVADSNQNDEHYQQYHEYYKHYYGDDYHKYYDYYAQQFYENQEQNQEESKNQEEGQEQGSADNSKGKGKKRKLMPQPKKPEVWFDADDAKNTNVYVSGLPTDITDEEYKELMTKCGLIMFDPFTKQPKLKLYKDKEGNLKGDGLCCYIKMESVKLALQIIDGTELRGHKIHVEPAKFELKGDFDPKKRKRLSNKDKKKLKEKQQKLFDWRPGKTQDHRFKFEKVVVLKNMFSPKEFEEDPTLINEWRDDVRSECSKYGEVKNVRIFDNHPDGVMTVSFKEPEEADACIAALNGRWFSKRQVSAETWDGKTKYEIEESEAERDKRLQKWENFLATGEKKSDNGDNDKSKSGADDNNSNNENKASLQDMQMLTNIVFNYLKLMGILRVKKLTTENSASSETVESKSTVQAHGSISS
ncbi:hypothetical protein KUTeg_006611 [Tegillarca granosa]|uniref:RRM domain-containing protein n=1 Tax=Tegillarca granosa TaxID=220873 RepID=A0ABQ9FCW4_TEGGR|nr:hypothetical protein KUTeg_006611 [Tegillarca granosa]